MTARPIALALSVVAFASNLLVAGTAHAIAWTAHQTQHAPPGIAGRFAAGPVRTHVAGGWHAPMVSPRSLPSGPVRSHHGMPGHFFVRAAWQGAPERSRAMVARVSPGAPRELVRSPAEERHFARLARFAQLSGRGPLRPRPMVHRPAPEASGRPAVRWPIGAGPHPVAAGVIPPSQRAGRNVWMPPLAAYRAGRR